MRYAIFFIVFIAIFVIPADSAVSSIDLGSEWLKVAVVNLRPNHPPISIAINEMSKRKSPALVAFSSGDRLLAEEAAGITARYPTKVYSSLRDLLAKPYPYALQKLQSLYLPYDLVEDSRGSVGIKIDDGVTVYSVEELVAMILSYGVNLAEVHAKVRVRDVVLTVPPFCGQGERKGLVQAAQLAGINVLALINEHAGVALQYGIDKNFGNESRHVIFYDMGSSSTYAALVHFSAYSAKEFGKTVSVNQFQVKDVRWNADLGGQKMESSLVEYFADEFNKQLRNGVDIRKSPKSMAKLKKQVKRTKEILSANTAAPISVESLYEEIDFRSTITREKFEELCGDLWEKALDPLKQVLKNSGLKLDDIYAVELIGGATRVPKLQAKLQEFLGRKDLDRHLDADEAIVLGASLHAANLSDGIKLNRKLGMIDGSSYGFMLKLDGEGLVKDETTEMLLVPRMKKMPIKLFRSIKHNKNFDVSLSYESANELPPGFPSNEFAQFSVSGLTEASEKYATRNLSAPIKANLHFSLSRSGIISFDRAEAVVEITEWIEVPKKIPTLESNVTNNLNNSTEPVPKNKSDDNREGLNVENEINNSNSSTEGQASIDVSMEKVLKKRTFRVPLKIVDKTSGPGTILSEELFSEAKTRLETLDKKDAERRRTAELKNTLEAYIYSTKEKLEDTEDLKKVSTEQERQSFTDKLNEVQEWLYTDGEDAAASEFKERLDSLKAIGDPIFFRLNELTARPSACEQARMYLGALQKIVNNWETNKPWLPKDRIDEVTKESNKIKSWLEEKDAQQNKNSEFVTPIFTSEEVYDKLYSLQEMVSSINRIPKPKPKVEKPPKSQESQGKENTTATTTDGDENSNTADESTKTDQLKDGNENSNTADESTKTDQPKEESTKESAETDTHDEL